MDDGSGKNAGKELQERAGSWVMEGKHSWELFVWKIRQWRGCWRVQVPQAGQIHRDDIWSQQQGELTGTGA